MNESLRGTKISFTNTDGFDFGNSVEKLLILDIKINVKS